MRNDQEFLAEIYSREEKYIKRKKKTQKAVLLSVIPLFFCTAVVFSLTLAPSFVSIKKSAPTANKETLYAENYEGTNDIADKVEEEAVTVEDSVDDEMAETPTNDGNFSASADAQGSNLKGEITEDSAHSQGHGKLESSSSEATKQDSVANNNGLLKEPEWSKEYKKKWKTLIDADSFTFIYKSRKICVNNETAVDKMKTIMADPYHKVVDFSDNSPEILTIEMGGMKLILKSQTLQNVTLNESYKLTELFMKAFKFILAENALLTDDLAEKMNAIINSFEENESNASESSSVIE